MAGDVNPLHVDLQTARDAGFAPPILHGLCSYGICQRAVLAAYCDFDAAALEHTEVRFRKGAHPGERLRIDLWRDGDVVSFAATVVERDVLAISNYREVRGGRKSPLDGTSDQVGTTVVQNF